MDQNTIDAVQQAIESILGVKSDYRGQAGTRWLTVESQRVDGDEHRVYSFALLDEPTSYPGCDSFQLELNQQGQVTYIRLGGPAAKGTILTPDDYIAFLSAAGLHRAT